MNTDFQVTLNNSFRLMTKNSMLIPFKQKFHYKKRVKPVLCKDQNNEIRVRNVVKSQMNQYQMMNSQQQSAANKVDRSNSKFRVKTQNGTGASQLNLGRYQKQKSHRKTTQRKLETSLDIFYNISKNPISLGKSSVFEISEKSKQKSQSKSKRQSNKMSSYAQTTDRKDKPFNRKMQIIAVNLNPQKLQERLSRFSKQKSRNFLRIYKQDFRKIFISRYGKDRITSFFQFQYIEDYDSINKLLNEIFTMSFEQIMVLSFLIMDFDKDGVISTSDIINLVKVSDGNKLILRDCVAVLRKFKPKLTNRGIQQAHEVNQTQFFQPNYPNQTLVRYRLLSKATFDKNINLSNILLEFYVKQALKKEKITKKISRHLFTINPKTAQKSEELKETQQKSQQIIKKLFNNIKILNLKKKVQINFQTYCKIFQNKYNPEQGTVIPGVFLDFLYVLGDIAIPGEEYLQIDFSVLQKKAKNQVKKAEQSNLEFYQTSLQKFKAVHNSIKVQNFENKF